MSMQKPNVYMRIRPAADSGGHAQTGHPAASKVLQAWDDRSVTVGWSATRTDVGHAAATGTKYDYPDAVFGPEASQDDVYARVVPPLLDRLIGGDGGGDGGRGKVSDVLLFAYGQTGTGKTHTTLGPDASLRAPPGACSGNAGGGVAGSGGGDPRWGIFPRAVYEVFDRLDARGACYVVSMSAVEFYLGMANDLLAANSPVALSQENEAIGLQRTVLRERKDVFRVLAIARHSRHNRHTAMNAASSGKGGKGGDGNDGGDEHAGSSRGHAMFILTVLQACGDGKKVLRSTFNLTDLAGAERPGKTGATRVSGEQAASEAYAYMIAMEKGNKVPELSLGAQAFFINFELYSFCDVIVRATEYNRANARRGVRAAYKPAALLNSPAVRIMGRCVSGDAVASVIVTLSQAPQCGWETWFSCEYGATLAKLRSTISVCSPASLKGAVRAAVEQVATNTAALERKIANKMIRWRRLAAIADARSRLVLFREMALKLPCAGIDPNDAAAFLLPDPPTTGWSDPRGNRYTLNGMWTQVSLEEFFAWDFSAPGAAESWLKMPVSSQRLITDRAMEAVMLDPVNQRWLARSPPGKSPIIVDTSTYAPCDNTQVKVFVHQPSSSQELGEGAGSSSENTGGANSKTDRLIVVYAHSGGGIYSSAAHASTLCARISAENDVIVLNVEYRLAPEHPAPAGIMDVVGVVLHICDGGLRASVGDASGRIVLMGDSGGGYIAAGAAAELVRRGRGDVIALCVPMWPQVSDVILRNPHRVEGGESAIMMWQWIEEQLRGARGRNFSSRGGGGRGPGAADASYVWINRTSTAILAQFPTTVIVTSEYDECRRMAEDFARRLEAAGKLAELIIHPGTHHCWAINMSRQDADEFWGDLSSILAMAAKSLQH